MKRIFRILVMGALVGVMATGSALARGAMSPEKQAKAKLKKDLKGWTIEGTAKLPLVALTKFYEKTDDEEKFREKVLTSQCETSVSVNVCRQSALIKSMAEYAKEMGSFIKDRFDGHHKNAKGNSSERDQEAYSGYAEKVLRGALEFRFGFFKEKEDGTREYKAFCIIDLEKAKRTGRDAVEDIEEMKEYGEEISNYINEFFKQ